MAAALPLVEEALARWRENGFGWGIGTALENLALVARQTGDWGRAVELFHEQIRLPGDPRDAWGVVNALGGLAEIAVAVGESARGARLLGAVGRMLEESGIALAAIQTENRERAHAAARLTLGEKRFLAEETAGRGLAFADVLTEALAVRAPRDGLPPPPGFRPARSRRCNSWPPGSPTAKSPSGSSSACARWNRTWPRRGASSASPTAPKRPPPFSAWVSPAS